MTNNYFTKQFESKLPYSLTIIPDTFLKSIGMYVQQRYSPI